MHVCYICGCVCISIEKLINHQKNNKCTAEKYISNLNAFQNDETRPDLNNCNVMVGGSDSRDNNSMDDITEDNANINNEQVDDHVDKQVDEQVDEQVDDHVDEQMDEQMDEQVGEQGIFVLGIKRMQFTFLIF